MSEAGGKSRDLTAAWRLYEVRRFADCLAAAVRALTEHPQNLEAHLLRALALLMLERNWEALQASRQAILLDPQSEWAHRVDAVICLESGHLEPARRSVDQAIRLLPRSVEAWSLAAEIELRRGHAERALGHALEALKIHPLHGSSLVRAAHAAAATRRPAEAVDFARRAVAANPLSASAHRALGVAAFASGDRATAKSALHEALRLDPLNERAKLELIRTLRGRSPVYRAMLWIQRLSRRVGKNVVRAFAVLLWLVARAISMSGFGFVNEPVVLGVVLAIFLAPHLIVPLHDLLVWRDPFGRLLLHANEKIAAAATSLLVALALVLFGTHFVLKSGVWAWAAAGAGLLAAFAALFRRVRLRWTIVRYSTAALLLAYELFASVTAGVRRDGSAQGRAILFVVTLVFAFAVRQLLTDTLLIGRRT